MDVDRAAARTLAILLPRLAARHPQAAPAAWAAFELRLAAHFPTLFARLLPLYGTHYDFFYHLEELGALLARMWLARPPSLQALDAQREADPLWYQSERMMGAVCYVDLFAGDLAGLRARIPYFQELGLTYLHLMPLFRAPAGNSDGGYAVSSYREVDPALGTPADLRALAADLRAAGISLVLDFVFNHTSDEHDWARAARAGDPDYRAYYYIFPDRTMPDAYERTLREIFPDQRPGNFTWRADMGCWVWTTFNSFQWDLNYGNPAVFRAMAEEMLFLANIGVEVLRLDALAFVWKQPGTNCENRPEAHLLIQAFNAVARIAAPTLLFKSEAIVHPDEVVRYISPGECQLSYNPLLMALLWNTLATGETGLLAASLRERFAIPPDCAWVNYVRVHDDIGWTFDDALAARLGINGYDHRRFLNAYFSGRYPGSPARGLLFGENPRTGDARISGTCASLAGLEAALAPGAAPQERELAIRRILLLYGVVLSIGGIPLLYLGDEVGTLNDYSYRHDPAKAADSRWVHRPRTDWEQVERRHGEDTIAGRLYQGICRLINMRQTQPVFGGPAAAVEIYSPGNPHVFGYVRQHAGARLVALANFSARPQLVEANEIRLQGLSYAYTDLVSGRPYLLDSDLTLEPYGFGWLLAAAGG